MKLTCRILHLQRNAVCRQKGPFSPLRSRAKIWYSINRHQSRKAIETRSGRRREVLQSSGAVSIDIKAERQLRQGRHRAREGVEVHISIDIEAERQLRRVGEAHHHGEHPKRVSIDIKAERQLSGYLWISAFVFIGQGFAIILTLQAGSVSRCVKPKSRNRRCADCGK